MEPKAETIAAFTVVGVAGRQSNDHPEQIAAQWKAFFEKGGVSRIPHRKSDDIIAVYSDYAGDHTMPYTMIVGCEVERVADLPADLVAKTVPAGRYVVLRARGPMPETVVNLWNRVEGLKLDRSYGADFDRYTGPDSVEVHVGVR